MLSEDGRAVRGLRYYGLADTTGYGIAGQGYVAGLLEHGYPVSWQPMAGSGDEWFALPESEWDGLARAVAARAPADHDVALIHSMPSAYAPILRQERAAGRRVLGYTVWEWDHLPDHWVPALNELDGVLVPCGWNVEIFRRSGVTVPIHVVPHLSQFEHLASAGEDARRSLQQRLTAARGRRSPASQPAATTFYTIGYYSNRKAVHLTVEAYLEAFTAADDVELIVKTGSRDVMRKRRSVASRGRNRHPSPVDSLRRLVRSYPRPPRLTVLTDEDLSDEEILALHEHGDCYVSLTRTEGWGLGAYEAARLGRPVVITGHGGHLDFLDPEDTSLVRHQLVRAVEPYWGKDLREIDRWAEPDVRHAAELMRAVHADRPTYDARGRRQAARLASEFDAATTLRRLWAAVER